MVTNFSQKRVARIGDGNWCSGGSRISRWWGAPTRWWGGANLQRVHFSAKTYAKTKEMDPVGGRALAAPPGSANVVVMILAYIIPQLTSTCNIRTSFEMSAPLCWKSVFIGYYGVISDIILCIFLVISALVLKNRVPIEWQAVMGLTSYFAENLY